MTSLTLNRISPWIMALLVAASPAAATQARSIAPLEGVHSVAVEIMIGDAIRVDDAEALRLFNSDHDRADSFESTLRLRVAEALRACDIVVEEEASHTIIFSFFGGSSSRNDPDCGGIFLLELAVVAQPNVDMESEERYVRGVLGTFDPKEPERALMAAAEVLLQEDLLRAATDSPSATSTASPCASSTPPAASALTKKKCATAFTRCSSTISM